MSSRLTKVFAVREAELRAAFLAGSSATDMVTAMNVLKESALINGDLDALRLLLAYTLGAPGKQRRMLPQLVLPPRTTLDDCGQAIDVVLDAIADGLLSEDEAAVYVTIIEKKAAILRAKLAIEEPNGDANRPIHVTIQQRAEDSSK